MEKTLNTRTLVWAHRGASAYAPENTLPAFQLAAEMKADGVELDVHLSADAQLIVCHDPKIDRTSDGSGLISEMTLEELRRYNFNNGIQKYGFVPVPTLEEVYALLAPTGLSVNVEIKGREQNLPALCCAAAEKYGMTDRVTYSSFFHPALLWIHEVDPYIPIAPLHEQQIVYPWMYAASFAAAAIHPSHPTLERWPNLIRECHMRGIRVNFWTVDSPERQKQLAQAGCDALITNKPDVCITALTEAGLY